MDIPLFLFYIMVGALPGLAWLFYYLRKDLHPEPKRMIVKVFTYGMLITIPVFFIQVGLSQLLQGVADYPLFLAHPILIDIIKWFLVIAFTEEFFKYAVVRLVVFRSEELDEPLDLMLYLVVAALGFATLENILYIFSPLNNAPFAVIESAVLISFIRFIGATFLHTLCSGLVGYFMVLSTLRSKRKPVLVAIGIILATLLHGLYDFSIISLSSPIDILIPGLIIIALAIFMLYDFDDVKKLKGICKL